MRALVIHESLTGNTREAARLIVDELVAEGWQASECSAREVDHGTLQAADVIVVGTWVDGLFFFGQRPGGSGKLSRMPLLGGKPTYVYVTCAIDPGKTLEKLSAVVEERAGNVVGGMVIKRGDLVDRSVEFARRVAGAAETRVVDV